MVKTISFIGNDKGKNADIIQYAVAVIKKTYQIRCMFDKMRRYDPVIMMLFSCKISVVFPAPNKINIFYVGYYEVIVVVFFCQYFPRRMINYFDVVARFLWGNRVVTGADFNAKPILVNLIKDNLMSAQGASPVSGQTCAPLCLPAARVGAFDDGMPVFSPALDLARPA